MTEYPNLTETERNKDLLLEQELAHCCTCHHCQGKHPEICGMVYALDSARELDKALGLLKGTQQYMPSDAGATHAIAAYLRERGK